MVNHNFDVNFPEAWTNSQTGTFRVTTSQGNHLSDILVGLSWQLSRSSCSSENSDQQICVYYAQWKGPKNDSKLYLRVNADYNDKTFISDALKSITFRQIGSKSCTQGLDAPTTAKDYSFSIDFSSSHGTTFHIASYELYWPSITRQ